MKSINKQEIKADVYTVDRNGNGHGDSGVLHAEKPIVKAVQSQRGRGSINADVKILSGKVGDLWTAIKEFKSYPLDGVLQQNECKSEQKGEQQRMLQARSQGIFIFCATGLSCKTAGAHAQKTQTYVEHIENGSPALLHLHKQRCPFLNGP